MVRATAVPTRKPPTVVLRSPGSSTASDERLHDAWRHGDKVAGNKLARRYAALLRSFFRPRLPRQEVEDLTQRVLLITIAQPDLFRGASTLHTYVFGVARRVLAERHRQVWRNLEDPRSVDDYPVSDPPVSEVLDYGEWASRLREVIPRIPGPYAKVLELHLEGVENHAIAAQLGVKYNTVRSRLGRAFDGVREQLELDRTG